MGRSPDSAELLKERVTFTRSNRENYLCNYVVIQFNPWFSCYFPLLLSMVMYDNEDKTKENKNKAKDRTEPQHFYNIYNLVSDSHFVSKNICCACNKTPDS